jgi:signal transduction histidine kinase/ActR/RegA family two-component response regulator
MRDLSTSLLFQFSIACFVILFIIVMVIGLVVTARLDATSGIGFLVLSFALIAILLNGSRTISQQQSDLKLANIGLEARVAERVEELRETNLRLTSEIEERRSAEVLLAETLEELQDMQQQLVQQERMQAMGQMASGVAHDFNNALSPILGSAELLLESPEMLDDREELIDSLQTIRTSALDAANVVRRLRGFYRGGQAEEDVESINVNEVIESSINLTRPHWRVQAQAEGRAIDIDTALAEVPTVSINESELREVLTNMIMNAADPMPDGGTITFNTRPEGEMVAIEVSDTGDGMTEEVRQRCLDPFFTTKGERGTGLGLAMVYGIIQRSHGTIDVASELGKGTTFTIRLPSETHVSTESELSQDTEPSSSLRILAVDDDSATLRSLGRMLRALGHSVELAASGGEGLEKFREEKYDLVVTDRAMPDMNGDQLADAIKEITSHQPVIMLTGLGNMMGTDEKPQGVDLVLGKPVTMDMLRQALLNIQPQDVI